MFKIQRSQLVYALLGELFRYWVIAGLLYFLAVGAEAQLLKRVLELYMIGVPLALTIGVMTLVAIAVYLYIRNRWGWRKPQDIDAQMQARIRRLSLTDVRPDENNLRQLARDYEAIIHETNRRVSVR
jgi:type VI protein secretion system component VasK